MSVCVLCDGLNAAVQRHDWNEPLFATPNFVVIPSLGALVEGWILVVPKRHAIAIGALADPLVSELQEVKTRVASALGAHYRSNICAFEHGPSQAGCSLGCGVDHAHLHLVPIEFDLQAAVQPFMAAHTQWRPATMQKDCRAAFEAGAGYLYFEQPMGSGHISVGADFGSQLFRRAIATRIGAASQFSWRDNPQLANVTATIRGAHAWTKNLTTQPTEAAA
jgi:diadenosine tetraphosphate (Ap4A) HIT family hydrolase